MLLGTAGLCILAEFIGLSASLPPLPLWIPTARNRAFKEAIRTLDRVVYEIIEERRQEAPHTDLLGMLLAARDNGEGMSDKQLRDEVLTMFLGGHETTANLLIWVCYALATHPPVMERLIAEVDRVCGDRHPTASDVGQLAYLRQVLDETLRLYPPAWLIDRAPLENDVINGYSISAKAILFISPYVMHRHPDYWDRPEVFDPDRFASSQPDSRKPFVYLPFGAGQRMCIGSSLALFEAQLMIAMLMQRYTLQLTSPVTMRALATIRPQSGLPLLMRERMRERSLP